MNRLTITESNQQKKKYKITNSKDFAIILHKLLRKEPRVVIIEMPRIGIFTLGIASPYGFVQYSKNGEPPYLLASINLPSDESLLNKYIEFDSGGTPSPVLVNLCIPYEKVVEIMLYCYQNRVIPDFIKWVPV